MIAKILKSSNLKCRFGAGYGLSLTSKGYAHAFSVRDGVGFSDSQGNGFKLEGAKEHLGEPLGKRFDEIKPALSHKRSCAFGQVFIIDGIPQIVFFRSLANGDWKLKIDKEDLLFTALLGKRPNDAGDFEVL